MMKRILTVCLLSGALMACGMEMYPGGDLPAGARLKAIQKGDTKEKVERVLGTPATESPALENGESFIVYAQNMKESNAFLDPKEIKRDVYVYYFNNKDILTKVSHLTLADKVSVSYDHHTTKTGGKEMSVLDEIVQNFGRYNSGAQDSVVRR